MEESIAISAATREQSIHFLTTLTVVNAIIHVGNVIAAAVAGGNAPAQDNLQKVLASLKEMLLPEDVIAKESTAKRAMAVLKRETSQGPLVATPKTVPRRAKGRVNGPSGRK